MLIAMWMAAVAILQVLPPGWLFVALVGCALIALRWAPTRSLRLVRRVRFLLLAIVVLFAGFTPGEAFWVASPSLSPSREGVMLAAEHAGRLLAVVLCVALLLERLPVDRLVSGLYALVRPFDGLGLPSVRLAVRLMLVLRYVESGPPREWHHWLEMTDGADYDGQPIVIVRESLGTREVALLGLLLVALLWLGVGR